MLTQDFKASVKSSPSTAGTTGGVQPGQAMSPEQFQSWVGGSTGSTYSSQVVKNLGDTFTQGAESIKKDITNVPANAAAAGGGPGGSGTANFSAVAQGAGHVAGDVAGTAWNTVGAFVSPLLNKMNDIETARVQATGKPIPGQEGLNTPQAQAMRQQISDWIQANPELAHSVGDVFNTAFLKGGVKATPKISEVASNVKNALTPAAETPEKAAARVASQQASQQATHAAQVKAVSDEWKSPALQKNATNPAQFNVARKVLAANPEAPDTLTNLRLHPAQHVENGRYVGSDRAVEIRDDAGQISRDLMRPALRDADYATPKTPVEDIRKAAIANITKDPLMTGGQEEAITRNINREASILEKKYPNGMSLSNMEDKKIAHGSQGGYRGDGSVTDNNIAAAHRNLSSAFSDTIAEKAPAGIGYKAFKTYLSKLYGAADYLDALNNKKAPIGSLASVARKSAQIGGFLAGHAMGGGVLPGVAGYAIGGTLENMLANMTASMRGRFLQNLELTNPQALQALTKYAKEEEAARLARPLLPPGNPANDVIQLPAAKEESSVTSVPATKNPPSINPKTGKPQTTYSSTPKEEPPPHTGESGFVKNPFFQGKEPTNELPMAEKPKIIQTIDRHTQTASQVMKEVGGDVTDHISTLKQNITLGLKAEGHPEAAQAIEKLDPAKFTSPQAFQAAANKEALVEELMKREPGSIGDEIPRATFEEFAGQPITKVAVNKIRGFEDVKGKADMARRGLEQYKEQGVNPQGAFHGAQLGRKIELPILLRKEADGTFSLVDGEHRLRQALINGDTDIISLVKEVK